MPVTTPAIKVDAVRALGAKVVLSGDSFDEAAVHAQALVKKEGRTFIHPFDDPDVIAGQGTVAVELVRQVPNRWTRFSFAVAVAVYWREWLRIFVTSGQRPALLE